MLCLHVGAQHGIHPTLIARPLLLKEIQHVLIDADGNLQPTRVVESIQMRHYLSLTRPVYVTSTNHNGSAVPVQVPQQNSFEFQFNRRRRIRNT